MKAGDDAAPIVLKRQAEDVRQGLFDLAAAHWLRARENSDIVALIEAKEAEKPMVRGRYKKRISDD